MNNHIVEFTATSETKIRIGVPADQPKEAIEALIRLFSEMKNVSSARLGLMEILQADGNSQFSYTIGVTCSSDEEHVTQKALNVLSSTPTGRWPISVVPATSQYFTQESIVFFERKNKPISCVSRLFSK